MKKNKYGKPAKNAKKTSPDFLDKMRSTGTGFSKEELSGIKKRKKRWNI